MKSPYELSQEILSIFENDYIEGAISWGFAESDTKLEEIRQATEWLLEEWAEEVKKNHYDPKLFKE